MKDERYGETVAVMVAIERDNRIEKYIHTHTQAYRCTQDEDEYEEYQFIDIQISTIDRSIDLSIGLSSLMDRWIET